VRDAAGAERQGAPPARPPRRRPAAAPARRFAALSEWRDGVPDPARQKRDGARALAHADGDIGLCASFERDPDGEADDVPRQACVTLADDLENCGACARACEAAGNGALAVACVAGECVSA
jgi:hypothetical protein